MHRIPQRLNGYDIIAQVQKVEPNGLQVSDTEIVILGHDPSRRNGAYVTAFIGFSDRMRRESQPTIREWYWGHYFEDLGAAIRSLTERSNMASLLQTETVL